MELDKVIDQVKAGKKGATWYSKVSNLSLPRASFQHIYAKPVPPTRSPGSCGRNVKGCFMTKEWEKYIPIVASAHEMMRQAMLLCDEARNLEKAVDGVIRKPHKKTGEIVSKTALISKPE